MISGDYRLNHLLRRLNHRRIQNALIDRTLLQQLLLELRVRDDAFSISSFVSASVMAKVETMSSSSDTDLPFLSSAIRSPI